MVQPFLLFDEVDDLRKEKVIPLLREAIRAGVVDSLDLRWRWTWFPCRGCYHFVKRAGELGNDWVCANPKSSRAGLLTFENQGCPPFEAEEEIETGFCIGGSGGLRWISATTSCHSKNSAPLRRIPKWLRRAGKLETVRANQRTRNLMQRFYRNQGSLDSKPIQPRLQKHLGLNISSANNRTDYGCRSIAPEK